MLFEFLLVYCLETLTFACILLSVPSAFLTCLFVLSCLVVVLYRVVVRGGGVRSPGEVGVLVHPPLGDCVKACVL